ncbi:MAG: family oxidoreductase [Conexibacter sp.]|nr:family oxidoreductase [Conexibacter sp.]
MTPAASTARFEGKVAVVTGGASGIGLQIVRRLVADGARVMIGDLDADAMAAVGGELGDAVAGVATDVGREADVEALVAAAVDWAGPLDLGFNCAGAVKDGLLVDLDVEDWDRVMGVTARGVFLSIKHEARQMIRQGTPGALVTITSINSVTPVHGVTVYNAAKAAAAMVVQNAALELGEHGIRSNAIAPGLIATPMTEYMRSIPAVMDAYMEYAPLGRTGEVDDVASAALFLASDEASWITGVNLLVDGGHRTVGYPNLTKLFEGLGAPADGGA